MTEKTKSDLDHVIDIVDELTVAIEQLLDDIDIMGDVTDDDTFVAIKKSWKNPVDMAMQKVYALPRVQHYWLSPAELLVGNLRHEIDKPKEDAFDFIEDVSSLSFTRGFNAAKAMMARVIDAFRLTNPIMNGPLLLITKEVMDLNPDEKDK